MKMPYRPASTHKQNGNTINHYIHIVLSCLTFPLSHSHIWCKVKVSIEQEYTK